MKTFNIEKYDLSSQTRTALMMSDLKDFMKENDLDDNDEFRVVTGNKSFTTTKFHFATSITNNYGK